MKFLVITHAPHKKQGNEYFAYAPYVREMHLWEKYVNEVQIVAPLILHQPETLDLPYSSKAIVFYKVPAFSFTSAATAMKAMFAIPVCLFKIGKAMSRADHIHLRCPGNIGLLGCLMQVFFPKKIKTAKYAGNWDPEAKQPLSYRFQKWLLGNTFLTKNMTILVYGKWEGSSKNILPFFTATYSEEDRSQAEKDFLPPFRALFVGTLVKGKDPLYTMKLIHALRKKGMEITLELYGKGFLRTELLEYVKRNNLDEYISLKGNKSKEELKEAYKASHFLILPSASEGWPKAVAEAMFWGCVPLATPVSCVPEMLGQGERGVLLTKQLDTDVEAFYTLLSHPEELQKMSIKAQIWSQQYTLEYLEKRIKRLL